MWCFLRYVRLHVFWDALFVIYDNFLIENVFCRKKIISYKKRRSTNYDIIIDIIWVEIWFTIYKMKIYSTKEVYLWGKSLCKLKIYFNKELIVWVAKVDLGFEEYIKIPIFIQKTGWVHVDSVSHNVVSRIFCSY